MPPFCKKSSGTEFPKPYPFLHTAPKTRSMFSQFLLYTIETFPAITYILSGTLPSGEHIVYDAAAVVKICNTSEYVSVRLN